MVPTSGGSISSSDESGEEARVVLSRRCSCWDRYWAGVCLAARAQWSSSLCRRGRFAWQEEKKGFIKIDRKRALWCRLNVGRLSLTYSVTYHRQIETDRKEKLVRKLSSKQTRTCSALSWSSEAVASWGRHLPGYALFPLHGMA